MKVFVTRPIPDEHFDLFIAAGIEVDLYDKDEFCSREVLLDRIQGVDAVIVQWEEVVDKELFDRAGANLKIVSVMAKGTQNIDLAEAKKRNVTVTNTPTNALFDSTAEGAVAMMLSIARQVTTNHNRVKNGDEIFYSPISNMSQALRHKTIGIVGMGNIGSRIARMMHFGFNNKIIYTSKSRKLTLEKELSAKLVDIDELFSKSDFVFISIASTPETKSIISGELITKLRPESIIVSISGSDVFAEAAIVDAVKNKAIYGVGLDIYSDNLKPLPEDNLILTAHMANAEHESAGEMAELCVKNVVNVLSGKAALTPVNS